jgi:hypothetical protein
MKKFLATLLLFSTTAIFAQLPQLKPEVVELYRLQQTALRSKSPSDYEAFFKHQLFSEKYFGGQYVNYAEVFFQNNDLKNAEKYFLKAAEIGKLNTVTFNRWFNMIIRRNNEPDRYAIPRTETNLKFHEKILAKIKNIEQNRVVDSRITAIADELREMLKKDQDIRRTNSTCGTNDGGTSPLRKVDSANIFRLIELIKENPDIDVLSVNIPGNEGFGSMLLLMHGLVAWENAWTDFFEPYFRERAETGKGLSYCFYYDRYRVLTKGGNSYYGEFTKSGGLMRADFKIRDENLDEINQNRAKVGLLPLYKDDSPPQPTMRITF